MIKLTWLKQAFRFLYRHPFSSLMFIVVITSISTAFLTIYALEPTIENALIEKEFLKYNNTDIEINLGTNYDQRFFSIRPLIENKDDFSSIVSIFVFPVQLPDQQSALIYFVDNLEFSQLIGASKQKLEYQQALVTNDLRFVNNYISLLFQEQQYDLEVINTIEKSGILIDIELPIIVMDKSYLEKMIALPGLINMANLVYLSIKKPFQLIDILENVKSNFPKQEVKLTKNLHIKDMFKENIFFMRLISLITIIPLSLTLFLLAQINFNKREKEMLILKTLGMPPLKAYFFYLFEYLIYLVVGFICSIPIWYIIVKRMVLYFTKLNQFLLPKAGIILIIGFITVLVYLTIFYTIQIKKLNQVIPREAESNKFLKQYRTLNIQFYIKIIIPLVILIISYLILNYFIFPKLLISEKNHLVKGLSNLILTSLILSLGLVFITSVLGLYRKQNLFNKIEISFITKNRLQSWLHLAIVFTGVIIAISSYVISKGEQNLVESRKTNNFNLIINNITINHDKYDHILDSYEEINWYEFGFCYQNIKINNYQKAIPFGISIDPNHFNKLFNQAISNDTIERMKDLSKLSIVLSAEYQEIYGIKIGDFVSIKITSNSEPILYQVAGFIEQKVPIYALMNDYQNSNHQFVNAYNALYLNTTNSSIVKNKLAQRFSGDIVTIIDTNTIYKSIKTIQETNKRLLILFVETISICLLLTLIVISSFMFVDKKRDYGIIWVMGLNRTNFFKKVIIIYLINLPFFVLGTYMISDSFISLINYVKVPFYLSGITNKIISVSIALFIFIFILFLIEWFLFKIKPNKLIRKLY